MNPRLKPLVFIIAALSAHSAFAETTLDPVVVTASRQPMRASEVLADVTVIEREEIQNAGAATTISDLLARQPGIELTSRGGPGTQGHGGCAGAACPDGQWRGRCGVQTPARITRALGCAPGLARAAGARRLAAALAALKPVCGQNGHSAHFSGKS